MNISTYLKSFVCFCFITIIAVSAAGQQPSVYKNGVLQSEFKVKLKREVSLPSAGLKSTQVNGYSTVGLTGVDKLNFQYEAVTFERLIPYSAKFNNRHQKHGLHLWYKVTINSDADIADVIKAYGGASEIQVAEPFYQKSLLPYSLTEATSEVVDNIRNAKTSSPFDDPRFDEQWHYHNTEDNPGTPGADINLLRAWEMEVGHPDVIVAVIDQGVDYKHEDLADNMWINDAELNGTPGEDSDGNGYIDDIYGFNFVSMTGDIEALDHGTHVAGTVAATNNNGIGVSGVAGGSGIGDGVRIMSCMIMSNSDNGDAAAAFVYAADNGAVITQNSWGYNTPDVYEQSELDAIDYFIEEAGQYSGSPMKGGVVIFAAGNNGEEGNYWPGCYEPVVAVVATGPDNKMASYSNFGDWVDVSAPGGETMDGETHGVLSTMPGDSYGFYDGTSMACPHVSGIAALIASHHRGGDFDNEQLIARLLGGTLVIDTMQANNPWLGKMGVGAVDAYQALQSDNGIAPDRIDDLTLVGASSDFAFFNWTVPADEDDDQPRYFDIYYSTLPFDGSNLDDIEKNRVNSALQAGELFEYQLKELEKHTTYYVGVTAIDRWGNESEISDILTVSTNQGAVISVDKDVFNFSIDVTDITTSEDQFTITNTGEGLLKWNIETRHAGNIDIYEVETRHYYQLPYTVNRAPEVEAKALSNNEIGEFAQKPVRNYIYYFGDDDFLESVVRIGESETAIPNSGANKFVVEDEAGFNLTGIEIGFYFDELPVEPVYIEVFKGSDIRTAQLIHTQSYWVKEEGFTFEVVEFTQQMFFKQDEEFFIAYHVPPGSVYPFLASNTIDEEYTEYSYYSSDQGATWKLLKDIYYDYTKVWSVIAMNELEELDQYVHLSHTNGYLQPNESQQIDFVVDGENLINGTYKTNLQIIGEGYENSYKAVELEFDVTGQKYKMESKSFVDFGNVFVGERKDSNIAVYNVGLGAFDGGIAPLDIQISDSDFSLIGEMPYTIAAERGFNLEFRLTPTKTGPINAKVTITEKDGGTHEFSLYGVGSMPSKAVPSPLSTLYENLSLDTVFTGHFYLKNEGEYPLEYYLPKFADGSNMEDFDDRFVHTFGYAGGMIESENGEPTFDWEDIVATGIDITDQFRLDGSLVLEEVTAGFGFPFFGNSYDTIYISKVGAVALANNGWFNAVPAGYGNEAQPSKLISAWGMPFDLNKGGKILYQKFPGKFIVQYDQVIHGYYKPDSSSPSGAIFEEVPITFQIVLYQNGDIEFLYKDLNQVINNPSWGFNRATACVIIEDFDLDDRLVLNGFGTYDEDPTKTDVPPGTGNTIYFKNPGHGVVQSVTNPYGSVHVSDSIKIEYTVETSELYVADFEERINVISNDPINPSVSHSIIMDITTGGEADYTFDRDEVDFGDVFQGGVYSLTLMLGNEGLAIGTMTQLGFVDDKFSVEGYIPVELRPGTFSEYVITATAENLGLLEDVLVFTCSEGTSYEITVRANVVEAPFINVDKTSIEASVPYGQAEVVPVKVSNTGLNPMTVTPNANEWMNVYAEGDTSYTSGIDYVYTIEYDADEYFNRTDIIATGDKLELAEDILDEDAYWVTVGMPYDVNYYGIMYDSLYVGRNGVITFIPDQDATIYGPDYYIPNENGLQAFLAPLFAFSGLADAEVYPNTGVYSKAYNDKFVVRFQDLQSMGGGSPISVEVWIFQNGIIKYMYDFEEIETANIMLNEALVGIENEDGTKGIQVSARTSGVIREGCIVTFMPSASYEVEAQSSKMFDVHLNASSVYGGEYTDNLIFRNNTPSNPEMSIPVTLNVLGSDSIVVQDTLDLGEVYIVDHNNDGYVSPYKRYDYEFTISNEGSRPLFMRNLAMQKGFATGIIMGDDEKFGNGNSNDGWFDISRTYIYHTLKPSESETFNLRITPMSEGEINDTIIVITDLEERELKIPVSALFTLPPRINIHSDGIHIYANTANEQDERSFTISNDGVVDLTYDFEILFQRQNNVTGQFTQYRTEKPATTNVGAKLETQVAANLKTASTSFIDRDDYNRILEYENNESSSGSVGYGGEFQFCAATGFTAPESGFNMSHVMLWYSWGSVLESEIEVQILGGNDDFYKTDVLYSQVYTHSTDEESVNGMYITIELDEAQFFFPYEKFYVMLKFDDAVTYPIGTSTVANAVTGRFYYGDGTNFFDSVIQGMGTTSWMIKAAEEEEGGSFWAMSDSEPSGILEPGETAEIDVAFNSVFAAQGINSAAITFYTNDPYNNPAELPLTLTRNKGPQFEDGDLVYHTMDEMEVWEYTLTAYDEEGDDFTLELKEEVNYLSCEIDGDQIHIVFEPDYDGEGVHTIEILGEDSWGNKTTCQILVTVNNVNRAPVEENIIGTQYFELENTDGYVFNLDQYIIDPDGDAVEFEVSHSHTDVMEMLPTGATVVFLPTSIGYSEVSITATDEHGAVLETGFDVFVEHRVGIDDNWESTIRIYPNPVQDVLYLDYQGINAERYDIIDASGSVLKNGNLLHGSHKQISVTNLMSGIYLLKIYTDQGIFIKKFTKQ